MTSLETSPLILSLLSSAGQFLLKRLYACVVGSSTTEFVVIPYNEPNLVKTLISSDSCIVDLDAEINKILDVEDKDQESAHQMLNSSVFYKNAEKVIDDFMEIMHKTGKYKHFVLLSTDYHLFKLINAGTPKIYYTMPSEAYYQELKQNKHFDDVKYQQIKAELMDKKKDKLIVHNSYQELELLFISKLGFRVKI